MALSMRWIVRSFLGFEVGVELGFDPRLELLLLRRCGGPLSLVEGDGERALKLCARREDCPVGVYGERGGTTPEFCGLKFSEGRLTSFPMVIWMSVNG